MALVAFSAKIGQSLGGGQHSVSHSLASDPSTGSATTVINGQHVAILIDNSAITTKAQLRAILREMEDRAVSSKAFT